MNRETLHDNRSHTEGFALAHTGPRNLVGISDHDLAHVNTSHDRYSGIIMVSHPLCGVLLLASGCKVHCDAGDADVIDVDTTNVTLQFAASRRIQTLKLLELIFQHTFYVYDEVAGPGEGPDLHEP